MARLTTWIDLNAYYPTYDTPTPTTSPAAVRWATAPLDRLGRLTGVNWFNQSLFNANTGPWVSFDRPET